MEAGNLVFKSVSRFT